MEPDTPATDFPHDTEPTGRPAPPANSGPNPAAAAAARVGRRSHARQVAASRRLIERVLEADTWDESVYFNRPDGDWILLTRDSWDRIKDAIDAVDAWRPWEQ